MVSFSTLFNKPSSSPRNGPLIFPKAPECFNTKAIVPCNFARSSLLSSTVSKEGGGAEEGGEGGEGGGVRDGEAGTGKGTSRTDCGRGMAPGPCTAAGPEKAADRGDAPDFCEYSGAFPPEGPSTTARARLKRTCK